MRKLLPRKCERQGQPLSHAISRKRCYFEDVRAIKPTGTAPMSSKIPGQQII
jgi:hypothetical protein